MGVFQSVFENIELDTLSISFAYSHPFVCFVYKSAVVEERQSSYLRLTSSDYGTARKILGGMP